MNQNVPAPSALTAVDSTLQVYLLSQIDFEVALQLQRRLVYDVAGQRQAAALIVCEHPPLVTVGRQGSWRHIPWHPGEFKEQRLKLRWVNRGGGCILHLPGQLAAYSIMALDRRSLGIQAYLHKLQQVVIRLLADFSIRAEVRPGAAAVWAGQRSIAQVSVAVRDWVAYFGAVLNVNPDLDGYRRLCFGGPGGGPATSIERERHGPVPPSMVRQLYIEHFMAELGFSQQALFFDHPLLPRKDRRHALVTPA